jgi:hypothetical protein
MGLPAVAGQVGLMLPLAMPRARPRRADRRSSRLSGATVRGERSLTGRPTAHEEHQAPASLLKWTLNQRADRGRHGVGCASPLSRSRFRGELR